MTKTLVLDISSDIVAVDGSNIQQVRSDGNGSIIVHYKDGSQALYEDAMFACVIKDKAGQPQLHTLVTYPND